MTAKGVKPRRRIGIFPSLRGSPHPVIARSEATKQSREKKETNVRSEKKTYVYILFNKQNGTLYVGVTSDLAKRVYEHKNKFVPGFTEKYGVDKLGYYEAFDSITDAIAREKQIKAGSRRSKLLLIERENPTWKDLYDTIL
jgi:putative endonuclease